jgi:hypothetical protein
VTLEELLVQQLVQDETLTQQLAKFGTSSAIFAMHAPDDTDSGWSDGPQYPRIDYVIDRHEDPERRVSGVLMINVWSGTDQGAAADDVEARLRELLDGAIFHPDDEPVIGLRWATSEPFESGRTMSGISMSELEPTDLIYGKSVQFDLLAFPLQTTFSPDPVAALNTWTQAQFSGLQVDPASWTPTAENPAVYWRFEAAQLVQMTAGVSWFEATLYGHVIAPTPDGRLPWVRRIVEGLALAHWIPLDDGSSLCFQKIAADTRQDPLRAGQIRLTARYGVLRPTEPAPPMQSPTIIER